MSYPPGHFEYSGMPKGVEHNFRSPQFDLHQGSVDITRNLFYEEAYRLFSRIENSKPQTAHDSSTPDGRVFELRHLEHRTGNHKTADAMVFVPNGFDASKPVKLVIYNHGLETNAERAFKQTLSKQMSAADSNTIVIAPEWQTKPDTRSSPLDSRFYEPQFFKKMLNEVMSKTPPLHNLKLDDISNIGVMTHSGGYLAAMTEMYKNGLYNKVTSLTVLDSMYNPHAFDRWVDDNIRDLASGRKQLQVVFTDHLSNESVGLARHIQQTLREHHMNQSSLYFDKGDTRDILGANAFASHPIVFKHSNFKIKGDTAHGSMTEVYVREILASQRGK